MKRIIAVTFALGLSATAAHAFNLWQGDMFITANSGAACSSVGAAQVGRFYRSVFRKGGLAGNGPNDLMSFVGQRGAFELYPISPTAGTLNGATAARIRYIFASAAFIQHINQPISGVTVTPADPRPWNKAVSVEITINKLWNKTDCNATFKGTLAKVP